MSGVVQCKMEVVVQEGINIILRGLASWLLCQKAGG